MNIKEFNEKRELLAETFGQLSEGEIYRMIQELQPPTPPKCVTCDHYGNHQGIRFFCKKAFDYIDDCLPIKNGADLKKHEHNFGCSKHSDYEVKNDTNG